MGKIWAKRRGANLGKKKSGKNLIFKRTNLSYFLFFVFLIFLCLFVESWAVCIYLELDISGTG